MGVAKKFKTRAMQRGIYLEKCVLKELENVIGTNIESSGFIILKEYGVIGASPDGIISDAVIEIKCPTSEQSFGRYINPKGQVAKKFLAQIHLQMLARNVKRGLFCVAKPDFEHSKQLTVINVNYDDEFLKTVLDNALEFWKTNVFSFVT